MENKVFTDALRNLGWNIEGAAIGKEAESDLLANGRLGKASQEVRGFITSFNVCANEENSIWFLSWKDYSMETDAAFSWNEFENQSMESVGDDDMRNEIISFWESHLPILMTVKNGYQYIAVGIGENNKDQIFYGNEPEYEEAVLIAESFSQFKKKYTEALNGTLSFGYYKFIV